ncbi:MAG: metal-dependent transcriptional regulator [Promethearchaeota archaeon]|jgi:DtxR family Mn-dependent transcriptional regulator
MLELDYKVLKEIFRTSNPLKVGDISKILNIPHSTVGSSVKRLEENGYVIYERYKPVNLSLKGINLAIELSRHARLLELLLYNELGLDPLAAHKESEKLNLLLSCNTINKICTKYEHPRECPCGVKIIDSSDCFCERTI